VAGRPPTRALPTLPIWALHSTADEVIPIGPTRVAIDRLLERDPRCVLEVIDDVTHFETARFAEPLARAVAWIRGVVWELDPEPAIELL